LLFMAENCKIKFNRDRRLRNEEKKSIEKRRQVNELYFGYRVQKREIARKEGVSRKFVDNWTQTPDQDFTRDNRGWEKDKGRKWYRRPKEKKTQLTHDPKKNAKIY